MLRVCNGSSKRISNRMDGRPSNYGVKRSVPGGRFEKSSASTFFYK